MILLTLVAVGLLVACIVLLRKNTVLDRALWLSSWDKTQLEKRLNLLRTTRVALITDNDTIVGWKQVHLDDLAQQDEPLFSDVEENHKVSAFLLHIPGLPIMRFPFSPFWTNGADVTIQIEKVEEAGGEPT